MASWQSPNRATSGLESSIDGTGRRDAGGAHRYHRSRLSRLDGRSGRTTDHLTLDNLLEADLALFELLAIEMYAQKARSVGQGNQQGGSFIEIVAVSEHRRS
jgi:hypothetical protein